MNDIKIGYVFNDKDVIIDKDSGREPSTFLKAREICKCYKVTNSHIHVIHKGEKRYFRNTKRWHNLPDIEMTKALYDEV